MYCILIFRSNATGKCVRILDSITPLTRGACCGDRPSQLERSPVLKTMCPLLGRLGCQGFMLTEDMDIHPQSSRVPDALQMKWKT
jgi:hypothetical protein